MKLKTVIDIETDRLINPAKVWLIVCKEITDVPSQGALHVFRNVTDDHRESARFLEFAQGVEVWIGHNWLEFDYPVLARLLGLAVPEVWRRSVDTLLLSRLFNYSDPHGVAGKAGAGASKELVRLAGRHSIDSYGLEFGFEKLKFNDFSCWSKELEEYCIRDVEICERIYRKYESSINDPKWQASIELEQHFQSVVNALQDNGFAFNVSKAEKLLAKVQSELSVLDKEIKDAFPAKLSPIKEVHPKLTRFGTLHKGDFRFVKGGDLSIYNGGPFTRVEWREFNPASHRQIIDVLHTAEWHPTDKTAAHIEAERSVRRDNKSSSEVLDKLKHLSKYGFQVNENNLATLPSSAPVGARLLARRILLESRRRTLTEWLALVQEDGRIHGKFYGIGAWTQRMAHQKPNTANIPNEFDLNNKKKLLGKELRSLWHAGKNRLLVGVDAEGIQLRIFAHYINDEEFTDALVRGSKTDKTDPHSLTQRVLGSVCKSRATAKRFIYALLLGAGIWKLSQILECSETECQEALNRLLRRYSGWAVLKEKDIPRDARRGYFIGLDDRVVRIPGDTIGERKHLAMSGYLQNGEAVCMKLASTIFFDLLPKDCLLVNLVHDEWQTETPNNVGLALRVAQLQANSLAKAGERLGLRCPLAGSYWNDEAKDYTIGTNWSVTH